ncbi:MAG: Verru_Chthon cassette protein D, partial [Verrucomicrobiota bacterium]|nr:Verru_Chthon cassette protein D [Verrucomicrobiota bacterium]
MAIEQGRLLARSRGFTLVELLAVMAILVVLLVLLVPASTSLVRSTRLTTASQLLTDEMAAARQMALTQNRIVEMRFYLLGETADSDNLQYRGFRAVPLDPLGREDPQLRGKLKRFSEPVIIASDRTPPKNDFSLSTILGHASGSANDTAVKGTE